MDNSENNHFNQSESASEGQMTSQSENIEKEQSYRTKDHDPYTHDSQQTSQHNSQIAKDDEQDARLMSMLIYLLSLFTSLIGPLVIWLIKRKESKLVDTAGKTYLNYFISYFIYSIVGVILVYIFIFLATLNENNTGLQIFAVICMIIISIALLVLSILAFICTIIACVKYMSGKSYKIPLTIPFIK